MFSQVPIFNGINGCKSLSMLGWCGWAWLGSPPGFFLRLVGPPPLGGLPGEGHPRTLLGPAAVGIFFRKHFADFGSQFFLSLGGVSPNLGGLVSAGPRGPDPHGSPPIAMRRPEGDVGTQMEALAEAAGNDGLRCVPERGEGGGVLGGLPRRVWGLCLCGGGEDNKPPQHIGGGTKIAEHQVRASAHGEMYGQLLWGWGGGLS